MKTLLAISAAPNHDSNSCTLLDEFCRGATDAGAQVIRVHLYDLNLPYFNYENRKAEPAEHPENRDMKMIEGLMFKSRGLVIASPVWNFSVPGQLKNLLDRMSYFGRVAKEGLKNTKQGNLHHLHCTYIFTTGAPWYAWALDCLAHLQTKLTLWYFGARNHGVLRAHDCGNGSKNFVKERPRLMTKAYRRGSRFAKKYLI